MANTSMPPGWTLADMWPERAPKAAGTLASRAGSLGRLAGGPMAALLGLAGAVPGDDPEALASKRQHADKMRSAYRGMFNTPGQWGAMMSPDTYHPPGPGAGPAPPNGVNAMMPPRMPVPMPPQGAAPPTGQPPHPAMGGAPGGGPAAMGGMPQGAPWWLDMARKAGVPQQGAEPPQVQQGQPGPPMSLAPPNPGPMAPPPSMGSQGFNFFGPVGQGLDGAVNDSASMVKKFYKDTFG